MNVAQDRYDKPLTHREKWNGVYVLTAVLGLIAFCLVHATAGVMYSMPVAVVTLVTMGLTTIKANNPPAG